MKTNNLLATLAVVVVGFMIVRECSIEEENKEYVPDKLDAFVMAKELMRKTLKSPSTATFASISESKVWELGGDEWRVKSYVDSQNGFGAMIRTDFTITMTVNREKETWRMTAMETKP